MISTSTRWESDHQYVRTENVQGGTLHRLHPGFKNKDSRHHDATCKDSIIGKLLL